MNIISPTITPAFRNLWLLVACSLLTACGGGDSGSSPEAKALVCDDSMKTDFKPDSNTTVTLVKLFKKGDPLALAGTPTTPTPPTATNDVCLVKLMVGPGNPGAAGVRSTSPGIGIELWLPSPANWNGRFHALGQGGWAGNPAIASTTRLSNQPLISWATVDGEVSGVNDGGHQDPDAQTTGSFAMLPDGTINKTLWTDLSSRSMHEMAEKTKALAAAYYLAPVKKSYLDGCSGGGRQGYGEAQNYPNDFDGILAGAPSIDQTQFFSANLYPQIVRQRDLGGAPLSAAQHALVSGATVSACDTALHGQHDGYVSDPTQCKYDPTRDPAVLCVADGGTNATLSCVTTVQAQAFNKFWFGPTADGSVPSPAADNGYNIARSPSQLWFGPSRGTNLITTAGAVPWVRAPDQIALNLQDASFAAPNFINATGNGVDKWKSLSYADFANMLYQGAALNLSFGNIDTHNADITAFRDRGGKLLTYHGLSDTLVPSQSSINYYTRTSNLLGGYAETQKFHRLFLVPGMGHCAGVGSANGLPGVSPTANPPLLATGQIYKALTDWVEKGTAPTTITVTTADATVSRPLCMYPQKLTYVSGDVKSAASYMCK